MTFLLHSVVYSVSPAQPRFVREELGKDMKIGSQHCSMKIPAISIGDGLAGPAHMTGVCSLDS